ncbi:MAG: ATP-binding protein, partial [Candidatus Dormibacteraceae bacterium]
HRLGAVREALSDTRVVLITGARQAGKSTLAAMALPESSLQITLDDEGIRRAAESDPAGFVEHEGVMVIDEIQRVPELLLAIKAVVDRNPRPGQFLLTGSANVLQLPRVADALPGRMEIIELWPLSQGELVGRRETFVDQALSGWRPYSVSGEISKLAYLERAAIGGFPEVVGRQTESRREAWFQGYLATVVQRNVRDIVEIERGDDFRRLIQLAAGRSGKLLKMEELARDAQLPPTTARRYMTLFQSSYLSVQLPAWSNSLTTRAIHTSKFFISDSGLLAYLLGSSPTALALPTGDAGSLLESFVVMELRRQLGWTNTRATLHHFRTRDGVEVDAVLEAADGRIAGIEVKAGATVRRRDFTGLQRLAEVTGDRFQAGLVLYTGRQTLSFGKRLWWTPISALWEV